MQVLNSQGVFKLSDEIEINIASANKFPVCPHCDHKLETIDVAGSDDASTMVYSCPNYNKLLSIGTA